MFISDYLQEFDRESKLASRILRLGPANWEAFNGITKYMMFDRSRAVYMSDSRLTALRLTLITNDPPDPELSQTIRELEDSHDQLENECEVSRLLYWGSHVLFATENAPADFTSSDEILNRMSETFDVGQLVSPLVEDALHATYTNLEYASRDRDELTPAETDLAAKLVATGKELSGNLSYDVALTQRRKLVEKHPAIIITQKSLDTAIKEIVGILPDPTRDMIARVLAFDLDAPEI